jgi:ABC-type nitrate/sulfonate/bicarbonate transport system ATPase subunit
MRVICSHVGVSFAARGRKVEALHDVSLDVRSGEFLSVVGPSGCGKTTLLRILADLIPPQSGTVIKEATPESRSNQALLVFQENNLFPWMTVLENAAFGLEMQGLARSERESRAHALLARLGLSGWENAYPRHLSVGMRQRVAVVRSFLSDPGLLLMDEPFAALDALTRELVHQELLDLWEQNHKTVIFVTHDIEEAILLSDRILLMSASPGTIVSEFKIGLPRPRTTAAALSDEVQLLKRRIHAELGLRTNEVVHAS